jgi:hypothetical protein
MANIMMMLMMMTMMMMTTTMLLSDDLSVTSASAMAPSVGVGSATHAQLGEILGPDNPRAVERIEAIIKREVRVMMMMMMMMVALGHDWTHTLWPQAPYWLAPTHSESS